MLFYVDLCDCFGCIVCLFVWLAFFGVLVACSVVCLGCLLAILVWSFWLLVSLCGVSDYLCCDVLCVLLFWIV